MDHQGSPHCESLKERQEGKKEGRDGVGLRRKTDLFKEAEAHSNEY